MKKPKQSPRGAPKMYVPIGRDASDIHIDTSLIPPTETRLLCATFLEAVKHFYEDPENVRRFEEWRKEYRGGTTHDGTECNCTP